jgi:putative ABC transport system permease protein
MIGEAFVTALRSIWSKKGRSFLTMLGVIIGVAQIIALIGLGQGVKQSVSDEVTQLGTNVLFVLPGQLEGENGAFNPTASIGASTLTDSDLALLKNLPEVRTISPLSLLAGLAAAGERTASGALIAGVEPDYFSILTTMELTAGRTFTEQENTEEARVIVLGKTVANQLFPAAAPEAIVGQTITISKNAFTVIGVMEDRQSASPFGNTQFNSMALLPYLTGKATNENAQILRMAMQVDPDLDIDVFARKVHDLLQEEHGANDITVFTQEDLLNVVDDILGIITSAIVGLASISLIVGGIGIMNIMLVSVAERTKEIGLRKAVGATRANILLQFLTESAVISLIGGAIGVAIATGAGIVTEAKANLAIVVNLNSILTAIGFSLAVGVIFGLLPAIRAAQKDPIEALRYE